MRAQGWVGAQGSPPAPTPKGRVGREQLGGEVLPVPASGGRSSLCSRSREAVSPRRLACSLALGKGLGRWLIGSVNLVRLFTESF